MHPLMRSLQVFQWSLPHLLTSPGVPAYIADLQDARICRSKTQRCETCHSFMVCNIPCISTSSLDAKCPKFFSVKMYSTLPLPACMIRMPPMMLPIPCNSAGSCPVEVPRRKQSSMLSIGRANLQPCRYRESQGLSSLTKMLRWQITEKSESVPVYYIADVPHTGNMVAFNTVLV